METVAQLRTLQINAILPEDCPVKVKDIAFLPEEQAMEEADLVVVIGGDGSIIHAAKKAARYEKAVLGINCGRLGYLSGLEPEHLSSLSALLSEDYTVETRSMLSAAFESDHQLYHKEFLNDAVVSKGALSRMIDVNVSFSEGSLSYRADGLIVSTATGATAYSMSAGGPIVAPGLDAVIVTPISAHSFQNRSIVFPSQEALDIRNQSQEDIEVYVSIDGEDAYLLESGGCVTIGRTLHKARILKIENRSFFDTLSEKLK